MESAIKTLQNITERLTERVSDILRSTNTIPPHLVFHDLAAEAHFLRQKIAQAEASSSSTNIYEDALAYVTWLEARNVHCRANQILDNIDFDFGPTLFLNIGSEEGDDVDDGDSETETETVERR